MDRVRFITHKGANILLLDASQCQAGDIFSLMTRAKAIIASQARGTLLTLTDVTGAQVNDMIKQQVKSFTLHNKPYVKAAAIVGVEGINKVLLDAVEISSKRQFQIFESLDQAKDWLADQK